MISRKILPILACTLASLSAFAAEDGPDVGAHSDSQSAADAIKTFANTDGAFLAAGLLKKGYKKDNLASILEFPKNNIVVLSLPGSKIREAFERSVSIYPQPNEGFLQISGFEVTFKKNGPPNSRIISITANGTKLEDSKNYTVAMPSALAHGGLGYFKIWENAKTVKTFDKTTMEEVLRGKHATDTSPRWSAVA